MAADHLDIVRRCPACAAVIADRESHCWLCRQPLYRTPDALDPGGASREVAGQSRPAGRFQFSLDSLLLLMTLIAVHLGAFVASPVLGVLLGIVGVLALVRTAVQLDRLRTPRPTWSQKVEAYFASLAATVGGTFVSIYALLVSGIVTTAAVSMLSEVGRSSALFQVFAIWAAALGILVCGLASVGAFVAVYWKTLPPTSNHPTVIHR
jgi:hypothetical protein